MEYQVLTDPLLDKIVKLTQMARSATNPQELIIFMDRIKELANAVQTPYKLKLLNGRRG